MKKLFYWLRKHVKQILCRHFIITEYCHDCGIEQPLVWWSDNEPWSELMERPLEPNMGGICCPECFDKRAEAKGVSVRWLATLDYRFDPNRSRG